MTRIPKRRGRKRRRAMSPEKLSKEHTVHPDMDLRGHDQVSARRNRNRNMNIVCDEITGRSSGVLEPIPQKKRNRSKGAISSSQLPTRVQRLYL